MDKLFWVDGDSIESYQQLFNDVNNINFSQEIIFEKDSYKLFVRIFHSLVNDYPIILLDSDFSEGELLEVGFNSLDLKRTQLIKTRLIKSFEQLLFKVDSLKNWKITLLTSGTTGVPKRITHKFESITKSIKMSNNHKDDIWGFAYNPTHMAGIQVFFQALLNRNTIVNIFNKPIETIRSLINKYRISHISATPTFYRLFVHDDISFSFIKQVSCGGEKLNDNLKKRLKKCFPSANVKNIYASTEAGSLFASEGENFKIPQRLSEYVKIIDNEIVIHKYILGYSEGFTLKNGWYYSGDIVEVVEEKPDLVFRFIHRKNEMINVGGNKVNPNEIEEEILKIENVNSVRVYGRENSVLGNILCAEIVVEEITEKEIRQSLSMKLQPFKIPRLFNFVEKIEITRTGKVKR